MRITHFKISNFRNIRYAECSDPPDLMVICGGNGSGKSAILEALMTAKEHAGEYGGFEFDSRAITAGADEALINLTLEFSEEERNYVAEIYKQACPQTDDIIVSITRRHGGRVLKRSDPVRLLLSSFSTSTRNRPGFFDYIGAHRNVHKSNLNTWDASFLNEELAKQSLASSSGAKFAFVKQYLVGMKMKYLQQLQSSIKNAEAPPQDPLDDIRGFFRSFFAPMEFVDVRLDLSPFSFEISTPSGIVDMDDLSSGEKEILNTYIHFHQLKLQGAIILFDEADAHLHPDLERRYYHFLSEISQGNQLWLTTHSPEMMVAAGTEALFTVLKSPTQSGANQFVRVTHSDHLHAVLSELMGSRGLVSLNRKVIFIEGDDSSTDRTLYESLYPPSVYNVTFVPSGNSGMTARTSERINQLLSSAAGFQEYYCIVDRDIDRTQVNEDAASRLFRLPVYHVENFLLSEECIFAVTKAFLGADCPYSNLQQVAVALTNMVMAETHVNAYAKALLDARLATAAKRAYDSVYQRNAPINIDIPSFDEVKREAAAIMQDAVQDGSWKIKCKGRDVLKAYCSKHRINYLHFRNALIQRTTVPPAGLHEIMTRILV